MLLLPLPVCLFCVTAVIKNLFLLPARTPKLGIDVN